LEAKIKALRDPQYEFNSAKYVFTEIKACNEWNTVAGKKF
jgi:hypothetical protein